MYSISHEWSIENFIELDEETTVVFRVNAIDSGGSTEDLKFKMSVKPKYGDNKDSISLYGHNLNKKDLKYSLVFNILDVNQRKVLARRADMRVHAPNESWGFPRFCTRADVVDNPSEMLPDGTLTILMEIGGFKRIANRSDCQKVRDNLDTNGLADLKSDLLEAFKSMEHSDFVFQCKEKEFACHKFILASRSDVFRAMFSHDVKEVQQKRIVLDDASPEVVEEFIKFLYTDAIEDTTFQTVSQLLPLAEKYNVQRLRILCCKYLLKVVTITNVADIGILGQIYNVDLLKQKATEYISHYPGPVMDTPGWQTLLKEAPELCSSIIARLSRINLDT
eukprot:snap_masked-scaffold922_size80897-processed-gene-0.3 protein:Tk09255 transcript:snap_masked-scaffold922_size80897-processed-gene-0.3-mRNA-1 annotation:"hypothetical protein LOTGIDRAFT_232540"